MAYDITSKTNPLNTEYEDSKNMKDAVNIAAQHSLQRERIKAAQPNKYTQTLQAINATLQTVNSGLQVAENVNTIYDQITTKSFKRDQLEKQNRLKEEIQGAINDNDWNKVATLAMSNMSVASQMPEYMDALGRMAKISGNEGSAALLRSVNTEQQGKLELEEVKNLGKLQVAQERNKGTIAAANIKGQWSYKTGLTREQMKQEGEDRRAQWQMFNSNQQKLFEAAQTDYESDKAIIAGKYSKGRAGTNPYQKYAQNKLMGDDVITLDGNGGRMGGTYVRVSKSGEKPKAEVPQAGAQGGGSPSYIEDFKNYTYSLLGSRETEQVNNKLQSIEDAGRAPSKEEQDKAKANQKQMEQAKLDTNQLTSSFTNRELDSALDNLDVEGVGVNDQLTNVLRDPDNYKIEMVTEQSKINNIINGGDNLKTPIDNSLSEKYKDVVSIAQITNRNTGKKENVYLNSQQANLFSNVRKFNKQYTTEYNKAMKKQASAPAKYTPTEINNSIKKVIDNPSLSFELTSKYGVPNTSTNASKIIYYTSNNPNATAEQVKNYVSSTSMDDAYYDQVYKGYRAPEEIYTPIPNIPETPINYEDSNIIERRDFNEYVNDSTKVTNEDKYNTHLIAKTSLDDELYKTLEGRDYLNKPIDTDDIVKAFNRSIKKAMYYRFIDSRTYKHLNIKDPNDALKVINSSQFLKNAIKLDTLRYLKDKYPEIYESYEASKNMEYLTKLANAIEDAKKQKRIISKQVKENIKQKEKIKSNFY